MKSGFFPDSPDSRRGKVTRYFIGKQEIRKADLTEQADDTIRNANIAEWFHIYLGAPSESDLEINPLKTKLDKLVDLLEVVMTDKMIAAVKIVRCAPGCICLALQPASFTTFA